jgi:hypothetical protein
MILCKITVEELSKQGRQYKWDPYNCDGCQRNMWGHGFVERYFSCCSGALHLKRYRCPGCRRVVTTRPEGYWAKIRSSIAAIYSALKARLVGAWPSDCSRQRGGHWLRRFVVHAKMEGQADLAEFLEFNFLKRLRFFP